MVAAGALAAAASAVSASCRDVVVGEGVDAAAELCDFVRRCYGDERVFGGCERFASMLEGASASTRAAFLAQTDLDVCLKSCPAALACLDVTPFCASLGGCAAETDCCGWSEGLSSCEQAACCVPLGVPCTAETTCCEGSCEDGVCGGRPCSSNGESCEYGDLCCSGVCREGVCDKKDCSFDGEPCALPTDCCPAEPGTMNTCEGGACQKVGVVMCQSELQPCTPMSSELTCCAGLTCRDGGVGAFTCQGDCVGVGQACSPETVCCGDGFCDDSTAPAFCAPAAACFDLGFPCFQDSECCDGYCSKSLPDAPSGSCQLCQASDCGHSVCVTGGPMSPGACGMEASTCIAAITAYDSFCRCTGWDALCVDHVAMFCGLTCPAQ